jgi:aminopeptidase
MNSMRNKRQNIDEATKHIGDILRICFEHTHDRQALIVADTRTALAGILDEAYKHCLPNAKHLNFDEVSPEQILQELNKLNAGDLAVMVQSTSFRLNEFRIRVELFKRGIKVIEHPHLFRMEGEEIDTYIDSLAYDPNYYRVVGKKLKDKIDQAKKIVIQSDGEQLVYDSTFESTKLNIGDYTGMVNTGGQFPIGEVFSEPKDLEAVNGKIKVFVFGDTEFRVNKPKKPITLVIDHGKIIQAIDSTPEFDLVLEKIRERENDVWVRELGFGMNRAFSDEKTVQDIGTYERMCGMHMSMGTKHTIYKKPNFKQRDAGFHVDIFPVTDQVLIDGEIVYQNGQWIV